MEVWTASLDDVGAARLKRYLEWLAPDEQRKHGRLATEALRAEYLLTRALSRWVLSHYEPSVAPSDWRFDRTEAGRPFVVAPRSVPCFNLANASGLVACAVSVHPVGVDVESRARGEEILETAGKVFAQRENADLLHLGAPHRARRAVELWTMKEAYLKARGEGINVRLERITVVSEDTNPERHVLGDVSVFGDDPLEWQLAVREIPSASAGPYLVAVAVKRGREPDLSITFTPVVPA